MQVPFKVSEVMPIDPHGYVVLTAKDLPRSGHTFNPKNPLKTTVEKLQFILDEVGAASSRAQGLSTIITSYSRFAYSNHKIFIKIDQNRIIGYIKTGIKNLIYCDRMARMREVSPLCVLDFYVDESVQRHGYGRQIYDYMLQKEGVEPHQLAIDRPSSKFLGFMKKHFGLSSYRSQTNNFVIFDEYFEANPDRLAEIRLRFKPQAPQPVTSSPPEKSKSNIPSISELHPSENKQTSNTDVSLKSGEKKWDYKSIFG